MAIYHFSGAVVSRSAGKSAIASAAYRSGEKLYDERHEKIVDYSRKQDVVFKEIMLPEGAPEWMGNREKLWNAVEKAENRKDAQLAREFNFSLPRELNEEQNIELAREFVQSQFVERGMVADLCIHAGKAGDGEEQPHAHMMLTLREVKEDGFGLKERSWNGKENLVLWREAWAECANKHLALNGIDQKIDHRTLEEQGIGLEAQKKIGPDILRVYDTRIEEHQRIAKENGDKILEDPSIALNAITRQQSTFTHRDLARFVNRHTIDAEQFQLVYEKIKASEQIIALPSLDSDRLGVERFTTKEMLDLESKMVADALALKESASIATRSLDLDLSNTNLSPQQQEALKHITEAGDMKCLVGYAGTGKSRLLDQAREVWEKEGYRVHGVTLSGIAAENLEAASGIESRTLASRSYYWNRGLEHLSNKDILVIDEAGMLGSRQIAQVLEETSAGGAKAVMIGDPQQLQAIEAGAAFRAISEQTGYFELTEIKRQQEPWQQEATKEFALCHTESAIALYEQHGYVHEFATQEQAKASLVEKWSNNRILEPDKTQIMLAYTRKDAQELNAMARDCRKENNELGEEQKLSTADGSKAFATGDRIYFLQNNRDLEVKNGSLGTIKKIDGNQVTVTLDKEDQSGNPRVVTFDLENYKHITHGYAATIHKAQGVTVDQTYILASKHLDSHAIYVGMSRHRESADLFWSKEEFANKRELEQTLGRDRSKDVTVDYLDNSAQEKIDESNELTSREQIKQEAIAKKQDIALDDFKAFQEKFEREHPELAAKAQEEVITARLLEEKRATVKERQYSQPKQEKVEQERPKSVIQQRDEVMFISPQEKRAEKMISKYHELREQYQEIKEKGRSRSSEVLAKGQMDRYARELCKDENAMNSLQKSDRELFKEMSGLKEREKVKDRQKGFEMEL